MSSPRALGSAALAIWKRDLLLFANHRSRFASTLFTALVSVTLFYYISRLVRSRSFGSPDEYYAFVVVGLVIFGVLTSMLSIPVATLRAEIQAGTFERLVLSPFGPVRCVASLLLFPLSLALVTGVLSLVFATLIFGVDLRGATALLALPAAALGAASFAPFGLVMAAAVVLFKQTNAGATFVIAGLTFVSGVYFPVELLPSWIRWASEVQPFTPAVELLRSLLVDTPTTSSPGTDVAKLAAFAVVTMPIGVLMLRGAVGRSRRAGTIIET